MSAGLEHSSPNRAQARASLYGEDPDYVVVPDRPGLYFDRWGEVWRLLPSTDGPIWENLDAVPFGRDSSGEDGAPPLPVRAVLPIWTDGLEHDESYEYSVSFDCDGAPWGRFRRRPAMRAAASKWEQVES